MKNLNTYISETERVSSIDDYVLATKRASSIDDYISEKFQVSKDYKRQYAYTPKDRDELIECIKTKIDKEGFGTKDEPLNLNDIDTSKITDMSFLFDADDGDLMSLSKCGCFDISDWDVSNVKNMYAMFWGSGFDGDISDWDVSNVENMNHMFNGSSFDCDISDWDVSSVKKIRGIFNACPLKHNPPKWYITLHQ